ncbi:MAG: hydantoinase/oxoprolinase N-terminal domain-containing protein, partial [Nitrospinota bacterium]
MSYRVGVDIGGTFTDMVVLDEKTGEISIAKSPTTPRAPIEGVLNAVRKLEIDLREVAYFVHGTTAATNAVVQRRGAKVGLITTQGFRDILEIMRCHREFHYDLQWVKPKPLVPRRLRVEVPERIDYKGRVIRPLDEGAARDAVRRLRAHGVEAIAVCFIFSFVNPAHERRMKEILKGEWPEVYVSTSSEILPEVREYERTSTVVIDAYVKPLINHYLSSLERGLGEMGFRSDLMIMTSGGGVVTSAAAKEIPVYTLSSGPAGGVIGSVYLGRAVKEKNLISMDMGGTSFDVSLVDGGRPRHTTEGEIEWG